MVARGKDVHWSPALRPREIMHEAQRTAPVAQKGQKKAKWILRGNLAWGAYWLND